jgi:cytochrome P450
MPDHASATTDDQPIALNADFFANPDRLYQELRRSNPVAKVTSPLGFDVWLITRYDDARAALTEPLLSKDSARFAEILGNNGLSGRGPLPFSDTLRTHMLNSDPPDHTRLRKLLSGAFTARAVARMRPRIEFPSATGSTTASERRWPGSKARSPSAPCSNDFRTCRRPRSRPRSGGVTAR